MPGLHTNNHTRSCGAKTVVTGQSTVYAESQLVSVNGDNNSHGSGSLIAGSNQVFANGIAVVNNTPDSANADDLCDGNSHCSPNTAQGCTTVFVGD